MELTTQVRTIFGKATKTLRKGGFIAAELYGRGIENKHITVSVPEFHKVFKEAGEHTVVNLTVGDKKTPALIQSVQKDYLSGDIIHIDFYAVRLDEKIKARIPIELIGEAAAIKEKGGILNKALLDIEVEALPQDLPHSFSLDISVLQDINTSLYVRDVVIPDGVKILSDPGTMVVSAVLPQEEKEEKAPVDLNAIKIETEEKKAERDKASKSEEGAKE